MGTREIPTSDISDQLIMDSADRVMMRVQHEDVEGIRQIDATREEVVDLLEKLAVKSAVQVELHTEDDEDEPRTFILDAKAFDKLSPKRPILEILKEAPVVKKLGRGALNGAGVEERRDYASKEWAGAPHKGKTTDAEKKIVQEDFDGVNERLKSQGLRQINLWSKKDVERYGLHDLARERGTTPK